MEASTSYMRMFAPQEGGQIGSVHQVEVTKDEGLSDFFFSWIPPLASLIALWRNNEHFQTLLAKCLAIFVLHIPVRSLVKFDNRFAMCRAVEVTDCHNHLWCGIRESIRKYWT